MHALCNKKKYLHVSSRVKTGSTQPNSTIRKLLSNSRSIVSS